MGHDSERRQQQEKSEYEPPRVEAVLTPEDLEREVLYAGKASPVI